MGKLIEDYKLELEQLNREEQLFGFEQSQFPMLQQIITLKDPFDKLWSTFYNFQIKETQWVKGLSLISFHLEPGEIFLTILFW